MAKKEYVTFKMEIIRVMDEDAIRTSTIPEGDDDLTEWNWGGLNK